MPEHEQINYVEFPAKDLSATKAFFTTVFGWEFTEYGPQYMSFSKAGLDGGFYQSDLTSSTDHGAALVVLFSKDLETTQANIQNAGGTITRETFYFPGGRRFHFADPNGNELAVWTDVEADGQPCRELGNTSSD